MSRYLTLLIIVALIAESTLATVRRVPSEYATIQEAVDACVDGDTVLVAPGIYTDNQSMRLVVLIGMSKNSITLKSEQGPATCIIDCQAQEHLDSHLRYGVLMGGPRSILDGFTIINGYGIGPMPGAIMCQSDGIEIRNCIITGNASDTDAGGILINARDINVTISNCLITGNRCFSERSMGGGVFCSASGSEVTLRNCVITGNQAAYGGGVACDAGTVHLENCIVRDNRALTGRGDQLYIGNGNIGCPIYGCGFGVIDLSHSCFDQEIPFLYQDYEGGWGYAYYKQIIDFYGQGNIVADPCFVDPGYWWDANETPNDPNDDFYVPGDYHLKSQAGRWDPNSESWLQDTVTSPCIDAGDPNTPIMYEPFPNGGIINMGAYGGTVEASKSYFGKSVCQTIVAGDINGDGCVDDADLDILMRHWLFGCEDVNSVSDPNLFLNTTR